MCLYIYIFFFIYMYIFFFRFFFIIGCYKTLSIVPCARSLLFILLHLFFSSMNPTTSAGPTANSVFVVTPPNGYTVFPGGMSQVPLYPNCQSQVHVIHGNPPGSWPSVSQQPMERTLKEGKALGVSETSCCREGWGVLHGWSWMRGEFWKFGHSKSSRWGWSWPCLTKLRSMRKLSWTASLGPLFRTLYFLTQAF